jgi:hypothetical protein
MATLPKVLINRTDIKSAGVLHFVSELRPALKKIADEYSSDVFGSRQYAPRLYVYALSKRAV